MSVIDLDARRAKVAADLSVQLDLVAAARRVLDAPSWSMARRAAYRQLVRLAGSEYAANRVLTPLFAAAQLEVLGIDLAAQQ